MGLRGGYLKNWLVFLLVLSLDQLTKEMARASIEFGDSIPVIDGLFNLTLVFNLGAAFGMFSDLPSPWRQVVLGGVSILALIVVVRFLRNEAKDDSASQIALFAILAGAIGNLTDRFRFGSVVDFLDFYYGTYHWPAFNIADSAICGGVALLMLRMIFAKSPNEELHPGTVVSG